MAADVSGLGLSTSRMASLGFTPEACTAMFGEARIKATIAQEAGVSVASLSDKPVNELLHANGRINANVYDNTVAEQWINAALDAVGDTSASPLAASRAYAMHSLAMYDVVQNLAGKSAYLVSLSAPQGNVSIEAAIASASHTVLSALFPAERFDFNTTLQNTLAQIPDGAAEQAGIAYGQQIGQAVLAARLNDGSTLRVSYTNGDEAGEWVPTAPGFASALAPHWAKVQPFALSSGSQFRPAGDPALDSVEYATAFNQVKALGGVNSTLRTADQTEIAFFWVGGGGSYTPPGYWQNIALNLVDTKGLGDTVSLFAKLGVALADAGIAAWDAKYAYNSWRPITAIAQAEADGNPLTSTEAGWRPLIPTPPHPDYVSGHSTFSGAGATILAALLGDQPFSFTPKDIPQFTREFTNFWQAAEEAGMSRIYGGIHFDFANQDGLELGQQVANWTLDSFIG